MTAAFTLAQELLACFETALAAAPNPPPAGKVMMRAGAEVTPLLGTGTDECCTGLAWVRIAGMSGVRELGTLDNVACFQAERTLTLELGVARCAPTAPISSVPTEDQWMAAAMQLDADQGSMEQAVCCAFGDLEGSAAEEVAVGEWTPFGVDGNCIGGTMQVFVRLSTCC